MVHLSLALLGPVEIEYDQRPLTRFRTKAVLALLIYLVCNREAAHPREALMTMLWPELPTKSAQNSLRHALYHLRKAVPEVKGADGAAAPLLLADRKVIQLNPAAQIQLDVMQFESGTETKASLAELESAVALYRGDFLSGFYLPGSANFESWVQARREALRRLLLDALARLANEQINQGNLGRAETLIRRQLDLDNLREEAHQQLLNVLARDGRRTAALTHYQSLRQLLQEELGITPSSATERLVETIRDDGFLNAEPVDQQEMTEDAPDEIPHNLPPQATPFVGRKKELAALADLIGDPQTRLLTILGPGGMGKTRLALAAADNQMAQNNFPQGVFFVPLAGLSESERIVAAVAEALRIQLDRGESQLLSYLRAKKTLLILDNFEHLLDGSTLVNRLLQAAPKLQIMVTSRERLRLQGEQLYPIEGLSLVDLSDARDLFIQAARRLRPNFQARDENLDKLDHICRLVQGMPLALELAAAWVDLFTLEDITLEIKRNLDFLESDIRDMPARHRSMQVVFDTSWLQLTEKLQQVLAGLSVFRGGFTREAAASIIQASMPELAVLINKSLLSFDSHENRYYVHELLRQFSLARLTDNAVRDRHSAYYLHWLAKRSSKLSTADQVNTEAFIKVEMDNIRATVNQALRMNKHHKLELAIVPMVYYYENANRLTEGILFFDHIRTQLAVDPDPPLKLLFWATAHQVNFLSALGHKTEADQLWPEGQTVLETLIVQNHDTRAEQAFAFYYDGYSLYHEQPGQARQLLQQCYNLALELGDLRLATSALHAFAMAARNQGELDTAEAKLTDCLNLLQTMHDQRGIVYTQILLGELAGIAGRYDEAEQRLVTAVETARLNTFPSLSYALTKLQMVYFFSGRFLEAAVPLAEAGLLAEESNFTWDQIRYNICLGLLHLHEGRYSEANAGGKKALTSSQQKGLDFFSCEALTLLAQAQIAIGNYRLVKEHLAHGDTLCPSRAAGTQTYVAGNHCYWALVEAATGRGSVARKYLLSELLSAVQRKDKLNLANILAVAAYIQAIKNEAVSAVELYSLARQHPFIANSRWIADVIGIPITETSAALSFSENAAAVARGKAMDIWETAEYLRKLLAASNPK